MIINQIFFYDHSEINENYNNDNNETDDTFQLNTNNDIEDNNNIDDKYLKKNTFDNGRNYKKKKNNLNVKKSGRKTEELDEYEKERKLKKIEKILKTKILSNNINLENESIENDYTSKKINKDLFLNPDEENEEDKISSHLNQYLSFIDSEIKNKLDACISI